MNPDAKTGAMAGGVRRTPAYPSVTAGIGGVATGLALIAFEAAFPSGPSRFWLPGWGAIWTGCACVVAGILLYYHGTRLKRDAGTNPWTGPDGTAWNLSVARDEMGQTAFLFALLALSSVPVAFMAHWVLYGFGGGAGPLDIVHAGPQILGVITCAALLAFGLFRLLALHRDKSGLGEATLTLVGAPYRCGEELVARYCGRPSIRSPIDITAEIQCVKTEPGAGGKTRTVVYAAGVETIGLSGGNATIRFSVPEWAPGTCLSGNGPWYRWEITVKAHRRRSVSESLFPVPVYKA